MRIGLDRGRFEQDRTGDAASGEATGVIHGTPTLFIDGVLHAGGYDTATRGARTVTLPELHLADWRPTKDTLHLYCQIVGKIRLATTPAWNHWWNACCSLLFGVFRRATQSKRPFAGLSEIRLTSANCRPPPYHPVPSVFGRNRRQRFRLV